MSLLRGGFQKQLVFMNRQKMAKKMWNIKSITAIELNN